MNSVKKIKGPSILPKEGKPEKLVILLHGLGADGNDLIGLTPHIQPHIPDTAFVSPNAPFPCDMAPFGYQWFSMQSLDPGDLAAGIREAAPILESFIDEKIDEYGVAPENTAVIGFSQGTMMSLYTVPRMKNNHLAGIVGFSGALFGGPQLDKEATNKPPVLLVHGSADPVVPSESLEHADKGLSAAGFDVEAHMIKGLQHGIDAQGLDLATRFLKDILG